MIFIDTSYILASVNPRDALHARAVAWMHQANEPLITTEYVVWETVNALSQPVDRPKAHAVVRQLSQGDDCELLAADNGLFHSGLSFHAARGDKSWSLTDCISFVVMEGRGIRRALTHDHHFEQAGFEALLRIDPP